MVVLKIHHKDVEDFHEWFSMAADSAVRNGGLDVYCSAFHGAVANYYELTGNSGVLCYAKTKWG